MANMPWKPAKPGRPAVKGRDANAPRSMTTPPRRGRPKNKSIVPKKPDGKNQDPKATPKQGGGNRRLERTARRLTRGVLRDELRGLRSQKDEVRRAANFAEDKATSLYDRTNSGLGVIARETGDFVTGLNQQTQAGFNAQSVVQNAAAAALQNQLGNIYDAGEGSATAEMARLGLTGAQGFLDEMASGEAYAKASGAQTSANNAANLGMQQMGANTVGNMLSGMVQGTYLQGVGENLNSYNENMSDIAADKADQLALVRDAITDARTGSKDTFFQLLTQLQQSGWADKTGGGRGGKGGKGGGRPPAKSKDGGPAKIPTKDGQPPKKAAPPKKATPAKGKDKPKPKPPKVRMGPVKGSGRNGRGR